MNIRELNEAFNEIFDEIEQMNEDQIKMIDFEIEENINRYRVGLLKYKNECKSITIDTTFEDKKYFDKLKNNNQDKKNEYQNHNYDKNKVESASINAA